MLHILLLILKILGILLLVILGIVLTLLLLVLLVPVRYRGDAAFHGKPEGAVGVSWLLHLLRVKAVLDEGLKLKVTVKVLWFKVFEETFLGGSEEEEPDEGEFEELLEEAVPEVVDVSAGEGEEIVEAGDEMVHMAELQPVDEEIIDSGETAGAEAEPESGGDTDTDASGPAVEPDSADTDGPEKAGSSIQDKLKALRQTFKDLKKKYRKASAFVSNEENQKTFLLIKRQVWFLIKHVFPRKLKGNIRFGFDDPYRTGQVLTAISPFYALYARSVEVVPVFDEKVLEGELHLKGHIRAAAVLWAGARVFMNKNFRKLLRKFRG